MEKTKCFQWNENSISLFQRENKIWEISKSVIRVIAISEVINGDNDTTIYTIIDHKANVYYLDMLGLKGDNYLATYNFFVENYGLNQLGSDIEGKTVVFYPKELIGEYPYDKSLKTWVIRSFFNAGGGILSKEIKRYAIQS